MRATQDWSVVMNANERRMLDVGDDIREDAESAESARLLRDYELEFVSGGFRPERVRHVPGDQT